MRIRCRKTGACALLASLAAIANAQDVISERREIQHGTMVPIGESSIQRDTPGMGVSVNRGVLSPNAAATTVDFVVRVLAFQIPDFNPDDLYTHHYHVGMFSDTGNGSGTAYADDNGYVEYEQRTPVGEKPMTTFLYSVHAETGEVRVFIDVDPITVNRAAQVLTNLALNGNMQGMRGFGARGGRSVPAASGPVGDQRMVTWSGDYLTLDDLQEQIFQQTGCNVDHAEGDFRYFLVGCN